MNTKPIFEKIAGDFNSPFTRNYIFSSAFLCYPELLGIPVLRLFCIGDMEKITYYADISQWKACHEALKKYITRDYHYLENLIDDTLRKGEEFNLWTEKEMYDVDVSMLSDNKLMDLSRKFFDKQSEMYARGVTLPILDFQGFSFVENNLDNIVRAKVDEGDYQEYVRVFSEPSHKSFAQEQEEDLLRLIQQFSSDNNWKADILHKTLKEIQIIYPDFFEALQTHTKKYCWVYYVYMGPAYTEENFFDFIRDYVQKGIELESKLCAIQNKKDEVEKLKKEYVGKINPNDFEALILHLAGKMVWAKPRRKDLQSKSYYHFEKIQREIGRRLHLTLDQVRSAPLDILQKGFDTGDVNVHVINEIKKLHACIPHEDGTMEVLYGKDVESFIQTHIAHIKKEPTITDVTEISGSCAYAGHVRGIVKIINRLQDMHKMERGNILVSLATTPSIIPAIKQATAIITDEGGLTCHASIVSRELEIPCVVGTKIATAVFRDGDEVDVDATRGIVKKIS